MGSFTNMTTGISSAADVIANATTVSKEAGVKYSKFSVLIDDICTAIGQDSNGIGCLADYMDEFGFRHIDNKLDPSLIFIFDYEKLNDYGKAILEKAPISTDWSIYSMLQNIEMGVTKYSDIKDAIGKTKEFVNECRQERFLYEAYKFIFWSLMVLAVDKTDEDEHISLICNFAKMLNITDKEIADMIYIVKLIFNKVDDDYSFQSDEVVKIFGGVLNKYNYEF